MTDGTVYNCEARKSKVKIMKSHKTSLSATDGLLVYKRFRLYIHLYSQYNW